ncbi:hypothetical protein [Flavobacterium hydatis]|uniref:Uncharacterized protein n=1 Tax=Flavobacterium hydatis TaxID=991 RepID=A0A086A459_FLAHY|nr:hypothetical protein [Flavobacterium hydatis]KFF11473.1 hypothetical protein IW20_19495 [Flavobacterium hydatis]OXA93674.1 hypothetical protein B0A62_13060 [Flavobacterium hydatis]
MSTILLDLENSLHTNTFWSQYRSFCNNLHNEDINVEEFFILLPIIFKQIENNALSYQIYDAVNKFCEFQPSKGLELYTIIKTSENLQILSLIPATLSGLIKSERSINKFVEVEFLLKNNSELLKNQGYAFLATLTVEELNQYSDIRDLLYTELKADIENNKTVFFSQIVRVLGKFIKIIYEADEYLVLLSKSDSEDVLFQITRLLNYELDLDANFKLFKIILSNLTIIDSSYHGIINQLNYGVFPKLGTNHPELIEKFLKEWLLAGEKRASGILKFADTLEQFHEKNAGHFKKMVSTWLNSDYAVLHEAVSKILMELPHYQFTDLELDHDYIFQLSYQDIEFIVAKIVGFLYLKELIRSTIFSILKVKINDEQCVTYLTAIFNQYIVFNYPSTIEYLEAEKKNSPKKVKKVIDEIIQFNQNYYEKINQLDLINEFNPSDRRLKIYNSIHQKGFQIKHKETSESRNSFLNMCRTVQLRTGKGMFSKHGERYTEKTEMSRIQYSTEFPRGEFIDAIGQEKIRVVYRNYKREI